MSSNKGGSADKMAALNLAFEQALKECFT